MAIGSMDQSNQIYTEFFSSDIIKAMKRGNGSKNKVDFPLIIEVITGILVVMTIITYGFIYLFSIVR